MDTLFYSLLMVLLTTSTLTTNEPVPVGAATCLVLEKVDQKLG